jgi:ABC-2 type transport system ATP-binding protein
MSIDITTSISLDKSLLAIRSLTKRYADQLALDDIGFSVRPGEVLGLIGPNGAGKTTLLESIAGLLPVDSGVVLWRGQPLPALRRPDCIFYLPDGVRPWQDQYVQRVLAFFATVYGRSETQVLSAAKAAGLMPVITKRVHALSKGYARRLMWTLALLVPHQLLLMDEPFDGFDLRQTREMMQVLRDVVAVGRTLLLSIHQLSDAEQVCDRFVLLADGRIRGVGTLDELRAKTGNRSARLEEVFLALT